MPTDAIPVLAVCEKDISRVLPISPRSWRRLRARGQTPPSCKLGNRKRAWRISVLEAWLAEHEEKP